MFGALESMRADLSGVDARLSVVEESLARLNEQGTAVGEHLVQLNERVDGLADDMRLRFRQVNERLSGLAA